MSGVTHKTVPVKVWVDVDEGIADLVCYLTEIPGVRTQASCQGTIGEGGPYPYRAQVMCSWTPEGLARLKAEFDITPHGNGAWGYVQHPRDGWKSPSGGRRPAGTMLLVPAQEPADGSRAAEWFGTVLQAGGALWLALNLPSSGFAFPVMLAGAALWCAVAWREQRWSLFGLNLVFVAINIVGIVRWLG